MGVLFGVTIFFGELLMSVRCECNREVEANATEFLKEFDTWIKANYPILKRASWDYSVNLTEYQRNQKLKASKEFWDAVAVEADKGTIISLSDLCSNDTLAELKKVLTYRKSDRETTEVENIRNRISELTSEMTSIYSKAKVCLHNKMNTACYNLEPGLTQVMAQSRNEELLRKVWKSWRDATGKIIRQKYIEFVNLNKEYLVKKHSRFHDKGEKWRDRYNSHNPAKFEQDVKALLKQVMPLYRQIHSFVRRRIEKIYKNQTLFSSPLIPAHLLGNMWAQNWSNLQKELMPFPDKRAIDITAELVRQNYTAKKMFQEAESFFVSLNLTRMTEKFWSNSMIVRPDDREVVCHGSAWDLGDGKDFRIKMCTDINQEDFITIHHEMGHIEYDMQYSSLPFVYHGAANPGFHEAVGDTLALSVLTAKHLKTVGLLDRNMEEDSETDINFLMSMALDKIVLLPFAYAIERWRWDVFSGAITPENYTKYWWDLRCNLQGLVPPEVRSEEDFDPGAKYHIPSNVPYIRYFISFIVQFQFYEALCNATNHTGPLYKCDFYNNSVVGESRLLKQGKSKPWQDVLEQLTGSREINVGSLMRYFEPLIRYLKSVNGYFLEWDKHCKPPLKLNLPPPPSNCANSANFWLPMLIGMVMAILLQLSIFMLL